MAITLEGSVALVTGAGGGIGGAICAALAEAGAAVVATDVTPPPAAQRLVGDWLNLDVTSPENWESVIADLRLRHGRLDILVNNAGIDIIEKFEDMTLDSWRKTQAVNVEGVFLGILKALPLLRESGPSRRGGASVINMSSIAGLVGADFNAAYCASKGAVRLMTKALALEFSSLGYKIRVNSVHPGGVNTNMVGSIFQSYVTLGVIDSAETAYNMSAAAHALGRMAEPSEIAAGVRFLASDEASYMHGAELLLDGGYTAR
jgi:NAD(P)-dependent dehydrogenase (short-subunit alcohol dehydrogenase family)